MHAIYINNYLTDNDVANFARQSFGKLADNFTNEHNANLIRFLARGMKSEDWAALINQMITTITKQEAVELATYLRSIPCHWVPFGHPQITLRMRAPLPIRTQAFKHKIGFVESEESRRYISGTPEIFVPEFFRASAQNIKQGSSHIPHKDNDLWMRMYQKSTTEAIELYEMMIANGVCAEQARFVLPQGTQVNWVWTGSLYAFSNFYNQRSEAHAQKEIRDLAEQVNNIIAPLYPISWAALTQGKY